MMSGPVAVITGASSGIGSACVDEFKSAGLWTIGVDHSDRSAADEHLVLDLGSRACGDAVADLVGSRSVAALVNNGATAGEMMLLEASVDDWDRTMAVNALAPLLLAQSLHKALLTAEGGAIVNVASVHSRASSPGVGIYAASKAALEALTRAMALEWGPSIRVNCVLPGAVETPMLGAGLRRSGQALEDLARRHLLERVASPRELARVIRFIALEGSFMTGSSVVVDGGALSRLSTE